MIGPYELQDFFLYHVLRFGYRPTKVAYLAHARLARPHRRRLAGDAPRSARNEYDLPDDLPLVAACSSTASSPTSQFKRSALPDGPKVGRVARCRRAATGARRATPRPHCGSPSSTPWKRELSTPG